jgi:hypothetical protein
VRKFGSSSIISLLLVVCLSSGYDPTKVNLNQTQVLALLASSKSANNMTAAQSAQIAQLASDTQVCVLGIIY